MDVLRTWLDVVTKIGGKLVTGNSLGHGEVMMVDPTELASMVSRGQFNGLLEKAVE